MITSNNIMMLRILHFICNMLYLQFVLNRIRVTNVFEI